VPSPTNSGDPATAPGSEIEASEIEVLLNNLSAPPLTTHLCQACGSKMLYLEAMFCCFGGDRSWNIPLPVCPRCEDFRSVKTISSGVV
jgi:hypothetical protein